MSHVDLSYFVERLSHDSSLGDFSNPAREAMDAEIKTLFSEKQDREIQLDADTEFIWPYRDFGNISSNDHINLDTLSSFLWYRQNNSRYQKVFDIGANVGLHTVLLHKAGIGKIVGIEPDPESVIAIRDILSRNNISGLDVKTCAIAARAGEYTFVRVKGNTTSSHLKGLKTPYGPIDEFSVTAIPVTEIGFKPDFIKLDAEGAEIEIVPSIPREWWVDLEMWIEIHGRQAADIVFKYASEMNLNLFLQSHSWSPVGLAFDTPTSYEEGAVIMTRRDSVAG